MATIAPFQKESLSLVLPDDILAKLSSFTQGPVDLEVHDGQLTVTRQRRRVTLQELLDQCDPDAPISDEDKAWINMRPVGRELL